MGKGTGYFQVSTGLAGRGRGGHVRACVGAVVERSTACAVGRYPRWQPAVPRCAAWLAVGRACCPDVWLLPSPAHPFTPSPTHTHAPHPPACPPPADHPHQLPPRLAHGHDRRVLRHRPLRPGGLLLLREGVQARLSSFPAAAWQERSADGQRSSEGARPTRWRRPAPALLGRPPATCKPGRPALPTICFRCPSLDCVSLEPTPRSLPTLFSPLPPPLIANQHLLSLPPPPPLASRRLHPT